MKNALLTPSCRVAFAAYLHDLGKFAERARYMDDDNNRVDAHKQEYCPQWDKRFTHVHAAYTAMAFDDVIEPNCPDLIKGDMSPFQSRASKDLHVGDSLVNAAARHHRPETFLQWVVAVADRVASGFDRESFEHYNQADDEAAKGQQGGRNHYTARLLTLFEQVAFTPDKRKPTDDHLRYCYPLEQMTPQSIFPRLKDGYERGNTAQDRTEAIDEYKKLWDKFKDALQKIPQSHTRQWPLWLDHFDSCWQSFAHCIPSATAGNTKPDISLYDHSKATAALAVALWRYHHESNVETVDSIKIDNDGENWSTEKFLLVQGDFFGIQDFIFAAGSQTNKRAAKLLRGRSFQVSLFTELAALNVLETLGLPSTSQLLNAAGKFLIIAPNTPQTIVALQSLQTQFNQWFVDHAYGLAGVGLAWVPASCNDFKRQTGHAQEASNRLSPFAALMQKLHRQLEIAKLQRLDLCGAGQSPVLAADFAHGVCAFQGQIPADSPEKWTDQVPSCAISRDQIKLGEYLTKYQRLLIMETDNDFYRADQKLEVAIFGYVLAFTKEEGETGKFGEMAQLGQLHRCWDFSIPKKMDESLWNGYARRYINAYVPTFVPSDITLLRDKYVGGTADAPEDMLGGEVKTLNHIACEDRYLEKIDSPQAGTAEKESAQEYWRGQAALMTLKGDVDDLGQMFQSGFADPSLSQTAALSRQMNAFFAVWLPAFCQTEAQNVYTVFAGGDDFFLIGPWRSTQKLASKMAQAFQDYVAHNAHLHFSASLTMSKPGLPLKNLGDWAEERLGFAKERLNDQGKRVKNAVDVFGYTMGWDEFAELQKKTEQLDEYRKDYRLSAGYVYALIRLADDAQQCVDRPTPEALLWRSRFAYRTVRTVRDAKTMDGKAISDEDKAVFLRELTEQLGEKGVGQYHGRFKVALFNYFYQYR